MKKLAYFTLIVGAAVAVTGCVVEENTYVTTTRPHYHQHPVRHVERTQTVYYTQQPATSSVNVYYNKRDRHHHRDHRAPAPGGYYTQPSAPVPSGGYHTQPSSRSYGSGRHPGYSSQPTTTPAPQNNYGPVHEGYSSQPPAQQNNHYGPAHEGYSSQPSSAPVSAPQSSGGYQTQPVANNDAPKVESAPVVAETPKAQEPVAAPVEAKPADVAPVANTENKPEEKKEEKSADTATSAGYSAGTSDTQ